MLVNNLKPTGDSTVSQWDTDQDLRELTCGSATGRCKIHEGIRWAA